MPPNEADDGGMAEATTDADATHSDSDTAGSDASDANVEDGADADRAASAKSNRTATGWAASRVSRRASEETGRPPRPCPIDDERRLFGGFADVRVV